MQVILLERIESLGQMGDEVTVKPGFGRNYLLPQKKALRASKANRAYFDSVRADLEARNLERKKDAEAAARKADGQVVTMIRQAGDTGQLYGSVAARDIVETLEAWGTHVERRQVNLHRPIKTVGLHAVTLRLHPEVSAELTINVARSEAEAERQAAGLSATVDGDEDTAAQSAEDAVEDVLAEVEALEDTADTSA